MFIFWEISFHTESLGVYARKMDVDFLFCLLRGNVTNIVCRLLWRNMLPSFHSCFSLCTQINTPINKKRGKNPPSYGMLSWPLFVAHPNPYFKLSLTHIQVGENIRSPNSFRFLSPNNFRAVYIYSQWPYIFSDTSSIINNSFYVPYIFS